MKPSIKLISFVVIVMLVTLGCSFLGNIAGRTITPSNVIISESRDVSSFTGIDMNALGNVILSQGSSESLTISGSDNLVPLIKTNVRNGILYIETTEKYNVTSFTKENLLTYTIVVKDLDTLKLSGLGNVEMESLTSPKLSVTMSGAGQIKISQLTTDGLTLVMSGLGNVELAGEAKQASMDISGTGSVNSPDLKIQTADITLSGLGGATVWVTDRLTGNISGAGSISYYGNPQTQEKTSGLGSYKSLGNK